MNRELGAGEEQALSHRIFANRIDRGVVRETRYDLLPTLPAVAGAINVWFEIIETDPVDCGECSRRVVMGGLDHRDLAPRGQVGRRDVAPILPAVPGEVHQPIVGAGPDQLRILERGCDGIDDPAVFAFLRVCGTENPQTGWYLVILPRQIGADCLPASTSVGGLEEHVGCEKEGARLERRKDDRQGAYVAVLA